jgi:hypothetical protein
MSDDVEKSQEKPKIEYIPNVIVSITSGKAMHRKEVKVKWPLLLDFKFI